MSWAGDLQHGTADRHVEGVTEEEFVNALLAPHLLAYSWERVAAYRMGRARSRERRHGIKGWDVAGDGILRHLKSRWNCRRPRRSEGGY